MITKIREFISERANSYSITKKQYDYLLPIYGNAGNSPVKLHHRVDGKLDKYYFIGTDMEYADMLNRCKHLNENKETNNIIDYYNSKNMILVGMKTNLLSDMESRYEFKVSGNEIYFFDKGFHFGTLYKEGSFYVLKHDGTLDEYGWRDGKKRW